MKRILFLAFLLISVVGLSQPYVNFGSPYGNNMAAVNAYRAFQVPRGTDTTTNVRPDTVGMLFFKTTDETFWLRVKANNAGVNKWTQITTTGTPFVQTWQATLNVLNGNVLTQNNTIQGGNYAWVFDSALSYRVNQYRTVSGDLYSSYLSLNTGSVTLNSARSGSVNTSSTITMSNGGIINTALAAYAVSSPVFRWQSATAGAITDSFLMINGATGNFGYLNTSNFVPSTRRINGFALSSDVNLGLKNVTDIDAYTDLVGTDMLYVTPSFGTEAYIRYNNNVAMPTGNASSIQMGNFRSGKDLFTQFGGKTIYLNGDSLPSSGNRYYFPASGGILATTADIPSTPTLATVTAQGNSTTLDSILINGMKVGYNSLLGVTYYGVAAATGNIGNNVTAIGVSSASTNTGFDVTAIGGNSADENTGDSVTSIGTGSAFQNTGNNTTAIGTGAGRSNIGNNVTGIGAASAVNNYFDSTIHIGTSATSATAKKQVVLKPAEYNYRLGLLNLTADRDRTIANASGTEVLSVNSQTASSSGNITITAANVGALGTADSLTAIRSNFTSIGRAYKIADSLATGFLRLTGGTLTGALTGTTASFTGAIISDTTLTRVLNIGSGGVNYNQYVNSSNLNTRLAGASFDVFRLSSGTTRPVTIQGNSTHLPLYIYTDAGGAGFSLSNTVLTGYYQLATVGGFVINDVGVALFDNDAGPRLGVGTGSGNNASLHVKGSTSSTRAFLVTSNNNIELMRIDNAGTTYLNPTIGTILVGSGSGVASSKFSVVDTARGVLLANKTTTQENAISSPATGLTNYNTTDSTLKSYDGVAWQQYNQSAYGELYEDGGATGITVTTAGTYYQWTSSTAGLSRLTTPSATTDNITIAAGGGGVYKVECSFSYIANNNSTCTIAVFKNGTRLPNITSINKVSANDHVEMSFSGLVSLVAGNTLDIRVTSNNNGDVITPSNVNLSIQRIGKN